MQSADNSGVADHGRASFVADLQRTLDRSIGFRLSILADLGGREGRNFKAVRLSDGFVFVVRCVPKNRQVFYERLVEHLAALDGSLAVHRLFAGSCPRDFGEYYLLCLSWCAGRGLPVECLTDDEFCGFLSDYLDFSRAMQRVRLYGPPSDIVQWKLDALQKLQGMPRRILCPCLDAFSDDDVVRDSHLLRIVHGDFHSGNFHFETGRISGIFDLEEMRRGYVTDDIVRYVVGSAERIPWCSRRKKCRLLHLFRLAIDRVPCSRHEWRSSLARQYLYRVTMRTHRVRRIGLITALRLRFRFKLYNQLLRIVDI